MDISFPRFHPSIHDKHIDFDEFSYPKNLSPTLIKNQIFPLLDITTWFSLARVNRTFRKFSQSREAVKNLDLDLRTTPFKQRVKFALQAGSFQRKFDFGVYSPEDWKIHFENGDKGITIAETLDTLFHKCTNIESITLTPFSCDKITTRLTCLTSLKILNFKYFKKEDSFDFLKNVPSAINHLIFTNCKFNNLKIPDHVSSIQFINCNSNHIIELPSQLTTLEIVDSIFSDFALKNISNFQTFSICRSEVGDIAHNNIKHFIVDDYKLDGDTLNRPSEFISDHLESFTIKNCILILENWKYLPIKLKELRIISCIDSESHPIVGIPQEVRNLNPTCQIFLTSRESQKG